MSTMPNSAAATKSTAEYAYLQIFDANDPKERRKLLKHILTDQRTSLAFLLHCQPDVSEYELAFRQIADNPQHCSDLILEKGKDLSPAMRKAALETVMKDPAIAWDTAWKSNLTTEEKRILYEMHREYYLSVQTLDNYWAQWGLFGDIMHQEEIDRFIEMLYESDGSSYEAWDMMDALSKYGKLTPDQKDKIDSKLLAYTLRCPV